MPSYELGITLIRNKKRIGGTVSIGISRLPVMTIIRYFWQGWSIKEVQKFYPQLNDRDDLVVIKALAENIKRWQDKPLPKRKVTSSKK